MKKKETTEAESKVIYAQMVGRGTRKMPEDNKVAERSFAMIDTAEIHDSPFQNRKRLDKIEELSASIQAHGILNPLTVRVDYRGEFELIAGHRRLTAARMACLPSVPAIIINCDDREAAEMCVTENMQRCDLTPLEEAEGVNSLIGTGHTVQDVADRLGRSRQWVSRRRSLLNLCREVKNAVNDSECAFSLAPVEGLELISILPDEVQRDILAPFTREFDPETPTLTNIKRFFEDAMMDLDSAQFEKKACNNCLCRTGAQTDLFDEENAKGLGRCLDRTCFQSMIAECIEKRIDELKFDDEGFIVFSDCEKILTTHADKVVPKEGVEICKQESGGAVRACEIMADGKLDLVWVKPTAPAAQPIAKPAAKPATKAKSKIEAAKEQERMKFCGDVCRMIRDSLENMKKNPLRKFSAEDIIRFVVADDFETASEINLTDAVDTLWRRLAQVVLHRIYCIDGSDCTAQHEAAMKVNNVLFKGE